MPLAFGHLIPAWLVGKAIEKRCKNKQQKDKESKVTKALTRPEWFLLLWGAIFPDIDYLVQWGFGLQFHRIFTHSLFFAIVSALFVYLGAYILREYKQEWNFINPRNCAIAIFVGICIHLILDMAMFPGIHILWPYDKLIYLFGTNPGWSVVINNSWFGSIGFYKKAYYTAVFDMGIGIAWIGYLFFVKKIKF